MLLRGAILHDRRLNDMDFEAMRRHASTHDRIHGLNWQNRDSSRDGTQQGYNSQGYNSRSNGNSQDYNNGGQHMKWFPPVNTPGIPPSNTQASQWYQQTSVTAQNGAHSSGVMRLEDLQAQFGGGSRGGFNSNSRGQDRGYYSQDSRRGGGGSGYYQNQENRYGGRR
jgi:hypothetical protein